MGDVHFMQKITKNRISFYFKALVFIMKVIYTLYFYKIKI